MGNPHSGRRNADAVLVAALAGGKTAGAAAKLAGVGERTVRRRLQEEGFRREVRAARAAVVSRSAGGLAGGMNRAAATLRKLLDDEDAGVRLRAAAKLIELGLRAAEVVDLEARVAELEQAAGGGDGTQGAD